MIEKGKEREETIYEIVENSDGGSEGSGDEMENVINNYSDGY